MLLLLLPLLLLLLSLTNLTSSATIVTTITLSAPSAPTPTSPSYTSDTTFRTSVLNSTNTFRTQHNATALTWNATLATYASTYAANCHFAHSHGDNGENLAAGYGNVTATIDAWGNERKKYDFDHGGFGEDTGHFTQLVWKATRSVGCARKRCENGGLGWFVVCEYWPPGNVQGQYKVEVQKQLEGKSGVVGREKGALWSAVGALVVVILVLEFYG